MNKKAATFQNYLQEKNITCFQVEKIADDPLNTVVFRSFIEVDKQQLPVWIILDSSIYTMVRVQVAKSALKATNGEVLKDLMNKVNAAYKIFKYYLTPEGTLVVDAYILNKPEEVDPEMIYTVLDVLLKHLQKEYRNIMQVIWQG